MASPNNESRHSPNISWIMAGIVVGIMIGSLLMWLLISSGADEYTRFVSSMIDILLIGSVGFVFAFVVGIPLVYFFLRRFIVTARGTLEQVISEASAAFDAALKQDSAGVVRHAGLAAREAATWYAPFAARRFVVQTSLAIIVTFGGLVGTILLVRQTVLLGAQNERIDVQTIVMENQRRSQAFQTELSQILEELVRERNIYDEQIRRARLEFESNPRRDRQNYQQNVDRAGNSAGMLPEFAADFVPSDRMLVRIAALSQSIQPFPTLIVQSAEIAPENQNLTNHLINNWHQRTQPYPRLTNTPSSPERAQLFLALNALGVSLESVIRAGTSFEQSDFSYRQLRNINFTIANLRGARFHCAHLINVDLRNAQLVGADFSNATFTIENVDIQLRENNFSSLMLFGSISDIRFTNADMRGLALLPYANSFLASELPSRILPEHAFPSLGPIPKPLGAAYREVLPSSPAPPLEADDWLVARASPPADLPSVADPRRSLLVLTPRLNSPASRPCRN